MFVDEGMIVRVESATERADSLAFRATKDGTHQHMLLAVLINQHSALAAEVLAACLQDHDRAWLVGQRTYGRGGVQSIVPLKSDGGALRLTSARIVRPDGKYIHRFADAAETSDWGVQPSAGVEVRLSDEKVQQMQKDRQQREYPSVGEASEVSPDAQLKLAIAKLRAELDS